MSKDELQQQLHSWRRRTTRDTIRERQQKHRHQECSPPDTDDEWNCRTAMYSDAQSVVSRNSCCRSSPSLAAQSTTSHKTRCSCCSVSTASSSVGNCCCQHCCHPQKPHSSSQRCTGGNPGSCSHVCCTRHKFATSPHTCCSKSKPAACPHAKYTVNLPRPNTPNLNHRLSQATSQDGVSYIYETIDYPCFDRNCMENAAVTRSRRVHFPPPAPLAPETTAAPAYQTTTYADGTTVTTITTTAADVRRPMYPTAPWTAAPPAPYQYPQGASLPQLSGTIPQLHQALDNPAQQLLKAGARMKSLNGVPVVVPVAMAAQSPYRLT